MTKPVRDIAGVMAVMPIANVNTDAIIPSVWLRTATADMGKGLFGGQRYDEQGNEKPDFVLNRPPFREAKILLADENFGCGSSREAAVWALVQFGIGCVLAPSFADIFYENAFRNGLVAGLIEPATYQALKAAAEAHEGSAEFRIDLPSASVITPGGELHPFRIPASRAQALMRGDDEIAMTLQHQPAIEAHYAAAKAESDWLFPATLQRTQSP
ncbi:3-isopropylmalate dehydratase small subunit [Bosea caraganae]|uniref:3-isopropylmalate dehydratase n=1 Tax=Bosea caraganae TaxID=2763117 RepID=A0A370KYB3_9HYPH|nr:3-isopropylmalate dehydratase small subunit [Bosea caraganae]RDJ19971.1 3-isopropylmalate dehydratase small subunit [Bosea caraganae]RDJ23910.1 3-isopropylmalate dehydratase small subunit [Bosea caraganae]